MKKSIRLMTAALLAVGLGAGCSTPNRQAEPPPPALQGTPVVKMETALLATEAAALRQEIYQIRAGISALKANMKEADSSLATPGTAGAAGTSVRESAELNALRDSFAAEQVRLQARVAALADELDALRAAARASEEIPALKQQVETARQTQQSSATEAAEREQKLRSAALAEEARLQDQVMALTKEVNELRPMTKSAGELAELKDELAAARRQSERDQGIAAEREKQIRALREALEARPAQPAPVVSHAEVVTPTNEPVVTEAAAAAVAVEPVVEPPAVQEAKQEAVEPKPAKKKKEAKKKEAEKKEAEPAEPEVKKEAAPEVVATPPAEAKLTPIQQVAAANVALQQGNLARALALFRAALVQDESLVGARIGLAACAYSMDDLITARARIDEVLAEDPRNVQALGLRGILNWKDGRLNEADEDSAQAVEGLPGDPQLRNYRGIILHAMGRTQEAIAEMKQAIALDSNNGEAMLNLAILLASSQPPDLTAAAEWYEKALAAGAARDEGLDRMLKKGSTP